MIQVFGLEVQALILDIDQLRDVHRLGQPAGPDRAAREGQQKRYDLRIVGLGLVATRDGGIPLLSHAYPGNRSTSPSSPR